MSIWDKAKDVSGKALQKAKDSAELRRQQTALVDEARGKKLAAVSLGLTYVGGYGDYKKAAGKLTFYEKRTEFTVPFNSKQSFNIDNKLISEVAIEGRHEVDRRVTVTRLLAFGIFAFAAKKKKEDKEAFITVVLNNGQEAIFHLDDRSPLEAKRKLAGAIAKAQQGKLTAAVSQTTSGLPSDDLEKLADLKAKGIITEEEFAAKKKQLLGL